MITTNDAHRWNGSLNLLYTPAKNLSNKVTVGIDLVDEEKMRIMPYGNQYVYVGTTGEKTLGYRRSQKFNVEYVGNLAYSIFGIGGDFSIGTQTFWETETQQMGTGKTYAGPGVTTLSGGAETFSAEFANEVINTGVFVVSVCYFFLIQRTQENSVLAAVSPRFSSIWRLSKSLIVGLVASAESRLVFVTDICSECYEF